MKNFIEYFYNIHLDKLKYNQTNYSFIYKNNLYKLYPYENNIDLTLLYNINIQMSKNTMISEIILNKDHNIISKYNKKNYILLKIKLINNRNIQLNDILNLINRTYPPNFFINNNWGYLWENKIDYLERLINENGIKYPLLVDSFNYFVGLAENAISYYNNINITGNYKISISHRRIKLNDTLEELYNPLNIIYDFQIRDIAEYIKISFFNNNNNIFNELNHYFKNNNLSVEEIKLLISRIIYPSFYFNLYDDILINHKNEKILLNIISKLDEYEFYLNQIINGLANHYNIDPIPWLKKRL